MTELDHPLLAVTINGAEMLGQCGVEGQHKCPHQLFKGNVRSNGSRPTGVRTREIAGLRGPCLVLPGPGHQAFHRRPTVTMGDTLRPCSGDAHNAGRPGTQPLATAVELMTVARCAGRNREVIVKFSTLPSRAPVMANPTCRKCVCVADAGPCCSSCAADIMARARNPRFSSRYKKGAEPETPSPSRPSAQQRPFG